MRILMVVNIVLPKVTKFLDKEVPVTGGWLSGIVDNISKINGIKLGVASPYEGKELKHFVVEGVEYYLLPKLGLYDVNEEDCKLIFNQFNPDVLHIEGSEFKHSNTFINSWDGNNVLSLQGVVNGILPYFTGGLSLTKLLFSCKIPEIIGAISILIKFRLFKTRLVWERDTILKSKNILGRTNWDRSFARKFNSTAKYYSCNRILREPFYDSKNQWNINNIERYSIYIGNSYQPIKGFHFVIEAVSRLKLRYPSIKIYVAGISPYDSKIQHNYFKNGYALYLRYLISKFNLYDNFEFLGNINATEVANRLSKSNIYCLASSIENSPNTLAEAMILGVPSVASFVGGVSDMAIDNYEALLYRFDEIDMLVHQISRIFDDDELAIKLSKNARNKALKAHSIDKIIENLYKCYIDITK